MLVSELYSTAVKRFEKRRQKAAWVVNEREELVCRVSCGPLGCLTTSRWTFMTKRSAVLRWRLNSRNSNFWEPILACARASRVAFVTNAFGLC